MRIIPSLRTLAAFEFVVNLAAKSTLEKQMDLVAQELFKDTKLLYKGVSSVKEALKVAAKKSLPDLSELEELNACKIDEELFSPFLNRSQHAPHLKTNKAFQQSVYLTGAALGYEETMCLNRDPFIRNRLKKRALLLAAKHGHLQIFNALRLDIQNLKPENLVEILIFSSLNGHLEIIKTLIPLLVSLIGNFDGLPESINLAICQAAAKGHTLVVKELIPLLLNFEDELISDSLESALSEAAEHGHFGVIEAILISFPNLTNDQIILILTKSLHSDVNDNTKLSIAKKLLAYPVLRAPQIKILIKEAVACDNPVLIQEFLRFPGITDREAVDAFVYALETANQEILEMTSAFFTKANIPLALYRAASLNYCKAVKKLLAYQGIRYWHKGEALKHVEADASLELVQILTKLPLDSIRYIAEAIDIASKKDFVSLVHKLKNHPYIQSRHLAKALFSTIENECLDTALLLISEKALEIKDKASALYLAAELGCADMVDVLKALPEFAHHHLERAAKIAREYGFPSISDDLLDCVKNKQQSKKRKANTTIHL